MGHGSNGVVVGARLRDLDGARVLAPAEEGAAAGVADLRPVDVQVVVVKAGNERRRDDGPEPVSLLHHVQLGPAPEVQPHLRGLGSLDADLDPAGAVDAGIGSTPDVRRRGVEVTRFLSGTDARHQNERQSKLPHLVSPRSRRAAPRRPPVAGSREQGMNRTLEEKRIMNRRRAPGKPAAG